MNSRERINWSICCPSECYYPCDALMYFVTGEEWYCTHQACETFSSLPFRTTETCACALPMQCALNWSYMEALKFRCTLKVLRGALLTQSLILCLLALSGRRMQKEVKKKAAALTFFSDPPPRLSGLSLTTSRGKCEMISESKIQMLRGVSRGAGRKTFHTA